MRHVSRPAAMFLAGATLASLGVGVASAIPDPDGTVHACYAVATDGSPGPLVPYDHKMPCPVVPDQGHPTVGTVDLAGPQPAVTGPQGPTGAQGAAGPQGPAGPAGPSGADSEPPAVYGEWTTTGTPHRVGNAPEVAPLTAHPAVLATQGEEVGNDVPIPPGTYLVTARAALQNFSTTCLALTRSDCVPFSELDLRVPVRCAVRATTGGDALAENFDELTLHLDRGNSVFPLSTTMTVDRPATLVFRCAYYHPDVPDDRRRVNSVRIGISDMRVQATRLARPAPLGTLSASSVKTLHGVRTLKLKKTDTSVVGQPAPGALQAALHGRRIPRRP